MKASESVLVHRMFPPRQPSGTRHPALVMVHGRGADEEDLAGLAFSLDGRFLILSVRAPFTFEYGGYTWYDADAVGSPEPKMFGTSYELLQNFFAESLTHYPIDTSRVFLFGFSMGTVMSYALSLTMPERFRGVVAHSGYIPEGTSLIFRWKEIRRTRFFIAHGTEDPVIPVEAARRAKVLLEGHGAVFACREYPIGHEISPESLADAAAWLQQQIDS